MLLKSLASAFVPLISDRDAMFHSDLGTQGAASTLRPRVQLTHEQHSGTISESVRLIHGAMKGRIIAMRTEYLAVIAIVVLAAGTGLAVNSVGSLSPERQSAPAAMQVADR